MTSKLKQISLNTAAIAALMTAYPAATFAQSLDVTCSGGGVGGDFCQDADMTEVETVVNGNEADIATNAGDIADWDMVPRGKSVPLNALLWGLWNGRCVGLEQIY